MANLQKFAAYLDRSSTAAATRCDVGVIIYSAKASRFHFRDPTDLAGSVALAFGRLLTCYGNPKRPRNPAYRGIQFPLFRRWIL